MSTSIPLYVAIFIALLGAGASSCSDSPTMPPDDPGTVSVPSAYSFDSRFSAGESSVSYSGQIVRNLLIQDLASTISGLAKPGAAPVAAADLLRLYEHEDADNLSTRVAIDGRQLLEGQYNRISTGKRLSDNVSSAPVIGSDGANADALVRSWIERIAANAQDPSKLGTAAVLLDADGVDLSQMINKVLLGAVAYYRGTSVYLQNVLSKDNAAAADDGKGGKSPYTVMEHHWDEAFGYYGAARDYARYTDAQLAGSAVDYSHDSNGDGRIDLRSEYNFAFARNAAKRDVTGGTDMTKEIFDAFLRGRAAIAAQSTNEALVEQRRIVSATWEKVIAATVVHYLKATIVQLERMGTAQASPSDLSKVWSEGKGYTIALQYNSMKVVSDAQLTALHDLFGSKPVFSAVSSAENVQYRDSLRAAIELIRSTYGFTESQINAW
jgi:hypothetical protein